MDWSNEEYVRVYTRDTADDLELSWQALALWHAMLRKFDRSGIIDVRNGWSSIAKIVRIPDDVVAVAGKELERDGRVVVTRRGVFCPNFTEAQTARKSDRARQRESRDRRRIDALANKLSDQSLGIVTESQTAMQPNESAVPCHTVSHAGHTMSHDVTLCSADPIPIPIPPDPDPEPEPTPDVGRDAPVSDMAEKAVGEINRLSGRKFDPFSEANIALCKRLVKKRYSVDDALLVVQSKKAWATDEKMREWFRPKTLLGPENFASYLDEARAGPASNGQRKLTLPTHDEPPAGYYDRDIEDT